MEKIWDGWTQRGLGVCAVLVRVGASRMGVVAGIRVVVEGVGIKDFLMEAPWLLKGVGEWSDWSSPSKSKSPSAWVLGVL